MVSKDLGPTVRNICIKFNQLFHRRAKLRPYNTNGCDLLSRNWQNLVILDACRFDLFEEHNTLPGELSSVISRGSATVEFLRANFANRELLDTVYVTASPQLHSFRHEIGVKFHDVVNIWQHEEKLWNGATPPPEVTTEKAIDTANKNPHKRLIVHYTQPHHPFIGQGDTVPVDGTMWRAIREGTLEISRKTLWNAYADNLKQAFPHVERFMKEVPGRTVITSDHGNMLGERGFPLPVRIWGHPRGIYEPELVRVPWLVYDDGSTKTVREGKPKREEDPVGDTSVKQRLERLGYK